jgi:tetraacyldisaccharide-1-P 4'-kinase
LQVGGIKTAPIAREIARYLNAPVLMPSRGRAALVKPSDSARGVGAASKMLSFSGIDVYIGKPKENIEAIDYLEKKSPAIILNGGGPGVKNEISLLFFDCSNNGGNWLPLPAGPLRGTLRGAVKRCDAVLLNQGGGAGYGSILKTAKNAKKPVFFVKSETDATGLFGKYVAFSSDRPAEFFDELRGVISMRIVEKIPFKNHHFYTKEEIIKLFQLAKKYEAHLVCPEMDWIKLPRNIRQKVRFVPRKTTLQSNFYLWLEKKLGEKNEQAA